MRVLLAAAPTTPPFFRRWRRSSSLLGIFSGKIIFNFAFVALCGALQTHFSREGLGTNSLSQNLTVLPAFPKGTANPLSPLPLVASSSPEGGALDICWSAQKALTSGELARERLRGFSLLKAGRSFLRRAALSQKAARQLPFSSTPPSVKMQCRSVRRRSGIALL